MIKIIRKNKRKNPENDIKNFLSNLQPYENININNIGKGDFAETYKFHINNSKILPNNKTLYSGNYLIKRQLNIKLTISEIKKLQLLSKYGLIPKIYYIDERYQIMDYIKSINLFRLLYHHTVSDENRLIIFNKIKKLIKNWHNLGFCHGDLLNLQNYLITNSYKVYIIDPATHRECTIQKDLINITEIEEIIKNKHYYWDEEDTGLYLET